MGLGAIVVIGAGENIFSQRVGKDPASANAGLAREVALLDGPLTCVEVLGRTTVERMVERLLRTGVDRVCLIVDEAVAHYGNPFRASFERAEAEVAAAPEVAVSQRLAEYSQSGIDHCFVLSADTYVETDLLDLFYFHRESRQVATRAFDQDGLLDLWVVDCAKAQRVSVERLLAPDATSYFVREYVNRLKHPRDLRRFAVDSLSGRCEAVASGKEIKTGIWVDLGAEIHRRARLVAPVYLGRRVKVREGTLITRCSAVEAGSRVDSGSVIDDTSVLENTEVGICLDVCHAVVSGNRLLSLGRNCVLEIHDANLLRSTVLDRVSSSALTGPNRKVETLIAKDVKKSESEKSIQLPHGSWVPILSRE
ncbi:MAG: hypothetical protein ABSF59_16495 [Candidatus Sulfotelmatobacter sp.]